MPEAEKQPPQTPEAPEARRRGRPPKAQASAPKGTTVPKSPGPSKPLHVGRVGEPMAPGEARRHLYSAHVAIGKVIRSRKQFREQEFDEAGDAFADIANHVFPEMRLILRVIAPLVLVGALIGIWASMLSETPWIADRWARRGQRKEAKRPAQTTGPVSPMGGVGPTPSPEPEPQGEASEVAPPVPPRPSLLMHRRVG